MSDINNHDPLRTRREFCQQAKIGVKTLQRLERRGEAPPQIQITANCIRYRQSHIDHWINARTSSGARPAGRTPVEAVAANKGRDKKT